MPSTSSDAMGAFLVLAAVVLLAACAACRTIQDLNPKYVDHVFIATQYYRFRDPILDQEVTLAGPYFIQRNVFLEGATWKYRVAKDGISADLELR